MNESDIFQCRETFNVTNELVLGGPHSSGIALVRVHEKRGIDQADRHLCTGFQRACGKLPDQKDHQLFHIASRFLPSFWLRVQTRSHSDISYL